MAEIQIVNVIIAQKMHIKYIQNAQNKNEKKIKEYIKNQLEEDYTKDQITLKEYVDPFTGNREK